MARLTLARSATGEFGLDYNANNGRISDVYCTDPRGLSATVVLTDGTVVTGSLTGGQTRAVPGNKVQVTFGPDDEGNPSWTLTGVASLSFQFGAG